MTDSKPEKASLLITGLEPLGKHEQYNIELSWPVIETAFASPAETLIGPAKSKTIFAMYRSAEAPKDNNRINWLEDHASIKLQLPKIKRVSWQLAFAPTVNYRKLTGGKNAGLNASQSIPLALRIDGDVNSLVDHKPALGFELGTHALFPVSKKFTLKAGVQFNYSKYDIRAYKAPVERATISLNSTTGGTANSLVSYTDIRNFGGTSEKDLKNQYYHFSAPIGFELKLLGNDNLQLNIASTVQPTYMMNKNNYLITTDYKNYTKAPSLVRRWNINAGAEAFLSYNRGGVKWQVGPQFRYQLLSSYQNVYPIKEYLMEYGIKVGITKTIR